MNFEEEEVERGRGGRRHREDREGDNFGGRQNRRDRRKHDQ